MPRRFIKLSAALSIWLFAVSAVIAIYMWHWLHTERDLLDEPRVFIVDRGASLYAVASDLERLGFIRWPELWVYYARAARQTNIKAGEYRLPTRLSPVSLLAILNEGNVIQHKVSLIEGKRFVDFVSVLHGHGKILKTFEPQNHASALNAAGINLSHPEGWFYPDTYLFSANDTDISLLTRAHTKLVSVLNEEWQSRADDLPYQNSYEALIMASIIEKETGLAEERDEIAGVFVRRLKLGMRLDTDPTVIYGMGDKYAGNITRKDLRTPTAYNTYVIKGLPPTPIAMVGRAAIHAAMHPKQGNYLYFVAKGDGSHYFSETLEEHNRAVSRYQKRRRKDYRSAPLKKPAEDKD